MASQLLNLQCAIDLPISSLKEMIDHFLSAIMMCDLNKIIDDVAAPHFMITISRSLKVQLRKNKTLRSSRDGQGPFESIPKMLPSIMYIQIHPNIFISLM